MENGRPRPLLLTEPRHTPPKNFKHAKAKRRARTPVPQCALCATIDENFVFLRGFFREELCLPDQSCSSSCSCSGSYQALRIHSLDGGHNRERDSNSQNEEKKRVSARQVADKAGGTKRTHKPVQLMPPRFEHDDDLV